MSELCADKYDDWGLEATDALFECDRCHELYLYSEFDHFKATMGYWQGDIFHGMHKLDFMYGDYCEKCVKIMTPYIFMFKDIKILDAAINKLERNIRERRKND